MLYIPSSSLFLTLTVGGVHSMNTAVTQSTITFIDGEKGILRYRGYPIEQLAEKSSFLEVAYLLLYGSLPTKSQFKNFDSEIMHHSFTHRDLDQLVESFRYDAHPMAILASSFAALGSFAPEANPSLAGADIFTRGDAASLALLDKQIFRLIGKSATLAAMAYRIRQGRPFNRPRDGLSYTGSFLYLMDYLNEEVRLKSLILPLTFCQFSHFQISNPDHTRIMDMNRITNLIL